MEAEKIGSVGVKERISHNKMLMHVIEPILYGDIFDYPVTFNELHAFCRIQLSRSELKNFIQENSNFNALVSTFKGYFFLKQRQIIVKIREERFKFSEKSWKRALHVVNVIKYVPFIRGLLVTGSLAMNNVEESDDLDFLVIVHPKRIWFVFAILGTLQRIFSRKFLCPNYYLSQDFLKINRQTCYVAREALQARSIYGLKVIDEFYKKNDWIKNYYPNSEGNSHQPTNIKIKNGKGIFDFIKKSIELLLKGSFGNMIEKFLAKNLHFRLKAHYKQYGQTVPEDVLGKAFAENELRFHALNHEKNIFYALEERKKDINSRIQRL